VGLLSPNGKEITMVRNTLHRAGSLRWGLVALLLGLPLPLVILIWLFVGH
jgi:hypothetical protein